MFTPNKYPGPISGRPRQVLVRVGKLVFSRSERDGEERERGNITPRQRDIQRQREREREER